MKMHNEEEGKFVQWINKPLTYESRKVFFCISATIGAVLMIAAFVIVAVVFAAK
jgi:hypothetical protein